MSTYRQELFASGFYGAHSLPLAAPLAKVCRPFNREELKETGRNIRNLTNNDDGKIRTSGAALVNIEKISIFGLQLNLPACEDIFPLSAKDKILNRFLPPLLCAALIDPSISSLSVERTNQETPSFCFRSAALANLAIRPLESGEINFSYEWKMGPPIWLPAYKREK